MRENGPGKGAPFRCCHLTTLTASNSPSAANAGLLLPASLVLRLGLRELADHHLDLGDAPGRANTGDKLMTLAASALAGGDCIDDAGALRSGSTGQVLGCVVKAPSTLGTFLRSFRWGHVRQLDRVSRELLARAWGSTISPRPAASPCICHGAGRGKTGSAAPWPGCEPCQSPPDQTMGHRPARGTTEGIH